MAIVLACGGAQRTAAAPVVDVTHSRFAAVLPVDLEAVLWTEGLIADRVATCYEQSIPTMWKLMKEGTYKPFYEHFLIAAGKAEGGHHGAKWNDGDFYKWLEAAIATVAVTHDEALTEAIALSVEAIRQAQRADGYLHTPVQIAHRNGDTQVQPFQDRHAFEMYNLGHLMITGCLHHRVTGQNDLLDVARKAADFLIATFHHPTPEQARNSICPAHYLGAVELYRTTRDPRYLRLAQTFLEMRTLVVDGGDDNQDRVPFTQQREIVGHAVRANYLYAGAADLVAETGEPSFREPLEALWKNMVTKKMYLTGACGALYDGASPDGSPDQEQITRVHQAYGRNYQLPHTTAHNETCANIGNLMWSWRMFVLTGDAQYVDVVERAFYNSILSGVSLTGTEYFYVNPLRVVDPLPTRLRYPRTRQPFFTSFCCPPNLVRTIAELGGYAYSKSADAVWINLYGANRLTTDLLGEPLRLSQESSYPWDGTIRVKIEACPDEPFAMRLRIPQWAGQATLTLNDQPLPDGPIDKGYRVVHRPWSVGDVLQLKLPMQAKMLEAHPLVEESTNQVAFQRGPIVYCLESPDLPVGVRIDQVFVPSDMQLQARFDPDLLHGVTVLEGEVLVRHSEPWDSALYREAAAMPTHRIRAKFIPYHVWSNRGPSEMTVWLPVR
jgi:DUF1680 family protein